MSVILFIFISDLLFGYMSNKGCFTFIVHFLFNVFTKQTSTGCCHMWKKYVSDLN